LEINQRALLRLLALNREVPAALTHYAQFKQFLIREIEAEPEEATVALFQQIQRGDVEGLRPRQIPFAVPAPPTPLIGRAQEVQAVCGRLQDAKVHLLTIVGTGGVGKTRLAIEAAHALRYDFEDGVYFVDLAPLSDASLVMNAVAQVLGVPERPEQDVRHALRVYLRSKHLLLVCDNFEHVLPAASLVAELLAACPALKILTTSREPLVLRAEQQFTLEPLADADAVQLFVQCAQVASAKLAMDEDSLAIYSRICRRLDGLPLAIELIAAQARTLSPAELLHQLDRPLQSLAHGWRDAPERHRALRNAIQWSYDLLKAEEQRVFAHLGVFAGGCTAAAVQAVVGDAAPVLPVLETLCAASLVQTQRIADETRFTLLETIHEFAVEKLTDLGEYAGARERQAYFFAKRTEAAGPALRGPEQASWIQRLEADRENLRAALMWWYERDPSVGLQITTALWYFYEMRGPIREGREWLNSFLEKATAAPADLRAKALWTSGALEYRAGHYAIATTKLEDSLRLYEAIADAAGVAQAHNVLGNVAFDQEQYEIAAPHYQHSLEIRRRLGDRYGVASTSNNLALCSHLTNKLPEAETLFQESLSLYREIGDQGKVASVLGNMASLALTRNDPHQAKRLSEESLALYRESGGRRGIGDAHNGLGQALLRMNDLMTAREHFASALRLDLELMDLIGVIDSLAGLVVAAQAGGAFEHAAKLVGAIAAVSDEHQTSLSGDARRDLAAAVEAIRANLGPVRYERAWAAGRKLTLEQAVALALE
jgi:predicted ATPase